MANRWLEELAYTPEDGLPFGRSRAPARAWPRRRQSNPSRRASGLGNYVRSPVGAGVISSLMAAFVTWAGFELMHRVKDAVIEPPGPVQITLNPNLTPYIALKIERSTTNNGAESLAAPELKPLGNFWNSENGTRRIGEPATPSPSHFYAPVPRAELRSQYWNLLMNGVGRPALHVVYAPASWSKTSMTMHLNHWAAECHVEPDWILTWSRFPEDPERADRFESECVPGGVCLIVSRDCRDAFGDFYSR